MLIAIPRKQKTNCTNWIFFLTCVPIQLKIVRICHVVKKCKKEIQQKSNGIGFLFLQLVLKKKVIYDIRVTFWVSLIPTGIAFIYENLGKRIKGVALHA